MDIENINFEVFTRKGKKNNTKNLGLKVYENVVFIKGGFIEVGDRVSVFLSKDRSIIRILTGDTFKVTRIGNYLEFSSHSLVNVGGLKLGDYKYIGENMFKYIK